MKIVASVTPNSTKFGPLLYPGELERAVKELSEMGYDGIELSLRTPEDVDRKVLFDLLKKYEMELVSIATGQSYVEDRYSLFDEDPAVRKLTVGRLNGYIDILAENDGGSVILGGIKGNLTSIDNKKQFEDGCAAIDECLVYAEQKGITLLLEAINRYETNLFNTVQSCLDFVKERNSKYLKILPDTFHMNIEEASLKGALDAAAEYVGAIHCADSNRLAPGMGHVDFSAILKDLSPYTSLSYLGVEVLPLPDSTKCAKTGISTIRKCL